MPGPVEGARALLDSSVVSPSQDQLVAKDSLDLCVLFPKGQPSNMSVAADIP
jgi:hypothetical protein